MKSSYIVLSSLLSSGLLNVAVAAPGQTQQSLPVTITQQLQQSSQPVVSQPAVTKTTTYTTTVYSQSSKKQAYPRRRRNSDPTVVYKQTTVSHAPQANVSPSPAAAGSNYGPTSQVQGQAQQKETTVNQGQGQGQAPVQKGQEDLTVKTQETSSAPAVVVEEQETKTVVSAPTSHWLTEKQLHQIYDVAKIIRDRYHLDEPKASKDSTSVQKPKLSPTVNALLLAPSAPTKAEPVKINLNPKLMVGVKKIRADVQQTTKVHTHSSRVSQRVTTSVSAGAPVVLSHRSPQTTPPTRHRSNSLPTITPTVNTGVHPSHTVTGSGTVNPTSSGVSSPLKQPKYTTSKGKSAQPSAAQVTPAVQTGQTNPISSPSYSLTPVSGTIGSNGLTPIVAKGGVVTNKGKLGGTTQPKGIKLRKPTGKPTPTGSSPVTPTLNPAQTNPSNTGGHVIIPPVNLTPTPGKTLAVPASGPVYHLNTTLASAPKGKGSAGSSVKLKPTPTNPNPSVATATHNALRPGASGRGHVSTVVTPRSKPQLLGYKRINVNPMRAGVVTPQAPAQQTATHPVQVNVAHPQYQPVLMQPQALPAAQSGQKTSPQSNPGSIAYSVQQTITAPQTGTAQVIHVAKTPKSAIVTATLTSLVPVTPMNPLTVQSAPAVVATLSQVVKPTKPGKQTPPAINPTPKQRKLRKAQQRQKRLLQVLSGRN